MGCLFRIARLKFSALIVAGTINVSDLAVAETVLYDRVSQVVEISSGVFRDVYDVFSTDINSQFSRRLTGAPPGKEFDSAGAAYSEDGSEIVFYTYRHREDTGNGNTGEIYVMASDGSGQTRLTNNLGIDDSSPKWCGNDMIIFGRDDGMNTRTDIYLMSRIDSNGDGNGDNLHAIVRSNADEYDPACSPDGNKIAYVWSRNSTDRKIVVSDVDGSNATMLTSAPALCGGPRWSSDGQWLLYQCDHHSPQTNQSEIYRMKPVDTAPSDGEGDGRERLTNSPQGSIALSGVFSPDGSQIAYTLVTGPTNASYWKTIGQSDDTPIPGVLGRTFVSDWR